MNGRWQKRPYRLRRTEEFHAENLGVTVRFQQVLDPREKGLFSDMVDAWGTVGIMGGFGGVMHRTDPVQFDDEDRLAEWMTDIGSGDDLALQVLLNLFDQFAYEFGSIEEVILGTYVQE